MNAILNQALLGLGGKPEAASDDATNSDSDGTDSGVFANLLLAALQTILPPTGPTETPSEATSDVSADVTEYHGMKEPDVLVVDPDARLFQPVKDDKRPPAESRLLISSADAEELKDVPEASSAQPVDPLRPSVGSPPTDDAAAPQEREANPVAEEVSRILNRSVEPRTVGEKPAPIQSPLSTVPPPSELPKPAVPGDEPVVRSSGDEPVVLSGDEAPVPPRKEIPHTPIAVPEATLVPRIPETSPAPSVVRAVPGKSITLPESTPIPVAQALANVVITPRFVEQPERIVDSTLAIVPVERGNGTSPKPLEPTESIPVKSTEHSQTVVSELSLAALPSPPQHVADPALTTEKSQRALPPAEQVAETIAARVDAARNGGVVDFYLRLNPPDLGIVHVYLRATANSLAARLVVTDVGTRMMIESQLPELRQKLSEAGLSLGGFNIDHQRTDSQQSGRSWQQPLEWDPPLAVRSVAWTQTAGAIVGSRGLDVMV